MVRGRYEVEKGDYMSIRELYRIEADKLYPIYSDVVSWAIENNIDLWGDLCRQDNKLYEIKSNGNGGKELEFRVELEKFKNILKRIKEEHGLIRG